MSERVAEIRQENRGGDVSYHDIEWLCLTVDRLEQALRDLYARPTSPTALAFARLALRAVSDLASKIEMSEDEKRIRAQLEAENAETRERVRKALESAGAEKR